MQSHHQPSIINPQLLEWLRALAAWNYPDPAPAELVLDWRGKKPGEPPTIHEKKFDPPQHEISQS